MTTFLSDTFTDTDGTLLTAHTGEAGATWAAHPAQPGQATIAANMAYMTTGGVMMASAVPSSTDYDIDLTMMYRTGAGNFGILGRLSPTAMTYYMFRLLNDTTWQLYRSIAGTLTLLDDAPASIGAGTSLAIRLSLRNGVQRAYVDDVLVCEGVDPQIADAGRVGFRETVAGSPGVGKHLDMIRASAPASVITHPILRIGSPHIGPLRAGKA